MQLKVIRFKSTNEATLSIIMVDDKFQCFGLEDEHRISKITGETRIPAGIYKVSVKNHGGFHTKYLARFPEFHQGMLHVEDVPGFTDILIHIGNTEKDTAGCLLLGAGAHIVDMTVNNSTLAYKELYTKCIVEALHNGLTIEYLDADLGQKLLMAV